MAKPLQGREMSAVTISVSVSCLPVSGSAAEPVSLETRLTNCKNWRFLIFSAAGSMPVVQTRQKNILRNLTADNNEVTACQRS